MNNPRETRRDAWMVLAAVAMVGLSVPIGVGGCEKGHLATGLAETDNLSADAAGMSDAAIASRDGGDARADHSVVPVEGVSVNRQPVEATIGTAGGTVATADGVVKLAVASGGLDRELQIQIRPIAAPEVAPGLVLDRVYEFGPDGTHFAVPTAIQVAYDPATLPPGVQANTLRLHKLYADGWREVPGSVVDEAAHVVRGELHGFSTYAILGDPCAGVRCVQPPANACADGQTLRAYGAHGTCGGEGLCSYTATTQACEHGCADGRCKDEPCAGIVCDQPPANSCVDNATLRVAQPVGTCGSDGACSYTSSTISCEQGCAQGRCKADPCAGKTCSTPPASYCALDAALRVYDRRGFCTDTGRCEYASSAVTCEQGCENGRCKADPCAGVTCNQPPANACVDAQTLRVFDLTGVCGSAGECSYSAKTLVCQHGCASGKCTADPCSGVSCATPPANACESERTLRVYTVPGRCYGAGLCTYASSTKSCPSGCEAGRCKPDPCISLDCATPPAPACIDDKTLRRLGPGTCESGACVYPVARETCPVACENGVCVGASTTIGATGGTLKSTDGQATLTVSPQALSTNMTLSITPMAAPTGTTGMIAGTAYTLTPATTIFAANATLAITYEVAAVAAGLDASTLTLYKYNGSSWSEVRDSSVNTTTHVVSGPLWLLGTYAIMDPATAAPTHSTSCTGGVCGGGGGCGCGGSLLALPDPD